MLALMLYIKFLDKNKLLKLYLSLCCSLYFGFKFTLPHSGLKQCPDCYGNELCRFFQNQQIQLSWFSCFLSIINPNLTKSVFYGVFNDTEVIVKRKTGRTEKQNWLDDFLLDSEEAHSFILCSGVRDVQFLFDQIKDRTERKRLWHDLRTSIEPLLLMYFQTQGKWPFPKYYGACGDLIVEEYKGEPLINFLSSNFERRIFLAIQLLEMAKLFTFGHTSLAFYFTDYSLDNLVVDSNGNVFFIDLDNVIISNKSVTEGNNSIKRSIHKSEILDDNKYAFSPSDICQHYISDHNYFSVCKYLLSHPDDGLLKNIQLEIGRKEEILWLLDECSQPKLIDRFTAGQKLQILLEKIANDLSFQK